MADNKLSLGAIFADDTLAVTLGGESYHKIVEKEVRYGYGYTSSKELRKQSICGTISNIDGYGIQDMDTFERQALYKTWATVNREPRTPCKNCFREGVGEVAKELVFVVIMGNSREVIVLRDAEAAEKIARATGGDLHKVEVI